VSLRAAILGFLNLEPTTGYLLKQRFDGSLRSFWSVTQSQIYRELHALERERLVVSRKEAGRGRPDRKVYELTPAGRRELAQWLEEPLEPLQLRHPLLLKLVFASELAPSALDTLLADYAGGVASTLTEYRARLRSPEIFSLARTTREADTWRLAIEHGLSWCKAELAWTEKARKKLGSGQRSRRKKPV
jgi:PadR family transcriptional regulator AphA